MLQPNASAELLPYIPGSNLILEIRLGTDTPQAFTSIPGLYYYRNTPGAQLVVKQSLLQLPLFEYHDPVDQAFLNIGSLALRALDLHEKSVNPGRSTVFRFDITNEADVSQHLRLGAEGINAEWATVDGGTELTLEPRERRQATLVVSAPDDAQPGERAELFFVAESIDDPAVVALARVRATVVDVEAADITDEAGILERRELSKTPGTSLPVLALAVLALAALVRRRSA
ncbi:MAG TPA: hypothetical protein VI818_05110 [Candidatus Thermoplasmatota archaeon]|nr:hypothetical protein [Candidatus Thermoplasmatota archaeon]